MKRLAILIFLCVSSALPSMAVEPNEMLADPVLEARAREISKGLRCMQCQNETIDESNAQIAQDLRLAVRERLVAGDSNAETVAYIVARYGEFALLKPTLRGANLVLWLAAPLMLLLAVLIGGAYILRSGRRANLDVSPDARTPATPQDVLTAEEQARLDQLLHE